MTLLKRLFLFLTFVCCSQASAQSFVVSGKVSEYILGTPIAFATVKVNKSIKKFVNGTAMNDKLELRSFITDENGLYKTVLPKGEYIFDISAVGHIKRSKYINLKKDEVLDFEISEENNQLEDVEIKAQKAADNVKSVESSVIKLNIQNIKKLPIVFGEGDIIRALTLQPGVTTVGEGAGGFNVRGGKVDQNLVLLDDAPIFNTSHLLGLFTSINTEAVQSATLYKAGMPAHYGGRLSSLLNISTKAGTTDKKRGVGVGPISSNVLFQQPFASGKGSFLIAGRAAYPNLLLSAFPKRFKGSKAAFYDLNSTLQYRFTKNHSLKLTAYKSTDKFKFPEDTSYNWGSDVATAHWSSIITKQLSVNFKGILSHYNYGVNGLRPGLEFALQSKIRHHEVRTDLLYEPKNHKIEGGGGLVMYRFSPSSITPSNEKSVVVAQKLLDENGKELFAYLSDEWNISKRISLQYGVRYAQFLNTSGGKNLLYKDNEPRTLESVVDTVFLTKGKSNTQYGGFEPRASFKIELNDKQSIKGSFNRSRQFLHLISNTTAISPIDFWKLSDRYIKPQVANQYSLGYYRNFQSNAFEASIEGFYKQMNDLNEYKDGASLILNQHLETELINAKGRAYGVEFSLQKNQGRFTGNVAYTWSRSLVVVNSMFAIQQINKGVFYPSLYDKPHNLNLLAQYFLGQGWSFASTFTYQTGRPITYPDGQYSYNESLIFNYSKRNADRLPDFHRLDVSLSRDSRKAKNQKKYNILNISFYNLYARKNPYSIFFKQYLETGRSYRLAVLGTIVPSLTLTQYW